MLYSGYNMCCTSLICFFFSFLMLIFISIFQKGRNLLLYVCLPLRFLLCPTTASLCLILVHDSLLKHRKLTTFRKVALSGDACVSHMLVCAQLCPTLCSPARLLCPWGLLGRSTGVGCHFLPQGIFPS